MKKFISILLILAMLLSLCACGKSKAVRNVEEAINSIGEVSTKSKDVILIAKEAYNNLSDDEKAQIENYALLDAAVNNLFEKLREAMIADQFFILILWIHIMKHRGLNINRRVQDFLNFMKTELLAG